MVGLRSSRCPKQLISDRPNDVVQNNAIVLVEGIWQAFKFESSIESLSASCRLPSASKPEYAPQAAPKKP